MRLTLPSWTSDRNPGVRPRTTAVDADGPLFDEAMIAGFRRLVLLSRHTIAEGLAGEHRSRRRGSSPEFADFKMYTQGDDFRRIDWNLYARLDEVFVRLSEVTTELTVHVLLDCSNSMNWRSRDDLPLKFRYARQVIGALGYVALWHFDRVVVTPFGTELGHPFGPSQGRSNTVPMLNYLSELRPMGKTDLPSTVDRYVRARRRPGMMLIVSDLLSGEPEQLADRLRNLRSRGWQTIVAHIVDEGELSPRLTGFRPTEVVRPTALIDLESGERLNIAATDEVLARYEAAVARWLDAIESACAAERVDYLQLHTSWPLQSIVLRLLHARGLLT